MLLSRIPRGMAAAAGAAAVVAGTTFGVAAFADSAPEPTAAVNEAAVPDQGSFVADADDGNEGQADEARAQAEDARGEAADAASTGAEASVSQEEEEESEPQAESTSESSGGSDSSGSSGGGGGSSVPSGSPRDIARGMLGDHGWGEDQFSCLDNLWEKESNWDPSAQNPSSGAYGIPQSLPGDKMASAGSDWQTNPATQIEWGLGYIKDRYGSPCSAWSHSQANNWY